MARIEDVKFTFYTRMMYNYGYVTLMAVKDHFEDLGYYEECSIIRDVIADRGHLVPPRLTEEVLEDYLQDFWRMGMSGKTALGNIKNYVNDILINVSRLENEKL